MSVTEEACAQARHRERATPAGLLPRSNDSFNFALCLFPSSANHFLSPPSSSRFLILRLLRGLKGRLKCKNVFWSVLRFVFVCKRSSTSESKNKKSEEAPKAGVMVLVKKGWNVSEHENIRLKREAAGCVHVASVTSFAVVLTILQATQILLQPLLLTRFHLQL